MKYKTLIIVLFLLLVSAIDIQSQSKTKVVEVEKKEKVEHLSSEFGIVFGTPGTINLNYAKHFESFLLKFSGMYLGKFQGGQIDVGYKINTWKRTYQAITLAAGLSRLPRETEIYAQPLPTKKWNYASINYLLNTRGFLLSVGLSAGEGDFTTPQLMFQIGYSTQIWK